MKRAIFVALLTLGLASPALSADGCNFKTGDHIEAFTDFQAVERIEIKTHKYRKWVRNGLRILTSPTKNIPRDLRKTFGATIRIHYPFGVCEHHARIRQNGDWKDHIRFSRSAILRSIDVRMKTGALAGIVRFKLFLPETRGGVDEVYATELIRSLGYIAPRTRVISVVHDGAGVQMLFQEKPAKELLEFHHRREGPLFEGDETMTWGWNGGAETRRDLSLARLVNGKWAIRGAASAAMSAAALAKLQGVYSDYAAQDAAQIALDMQPENLAMIRYETLLLALNGSHALAPHNRQFFWNAIAEIFEPVYYDGDITGGDLKDRFLTEMDWRRFAGKISAKIVDELHADIAALDTVTLAHRISKLAGLPSDGFPASLRLDQLQSNLLTLKARLLEAKAPIPGKEIASGVNERFKRTFATEFPGIKFVSVDDVRDDRASVKQCGAHDLCNQDMLPLDALVSVMEGDLIGADKTLQTLFSDARPLPPTEVWRAPGLDLQIRHRVGAKVEWSIQENRISLIQSDPMDWFLISGALDDIHVSLEASDRFTASSGQRFNAYGLTGCLTFHNTRFDGTTITALGGGCEDAVNIVGGGGRVAEIVVKNAPFDGLDMDFADIEVDEIHIANAGNDCVDVSSGAYQLTNLRLDHCGDKGVSVGEGSSVDIASVTIANAAIGVAVKDSSSATIKRLAATDVARCSEAYRKKQEFGGARLQIEAMDCVGDVAGGPNSVMLIGGAPM